MKIVYILEQFYQHGGAEKIVAEKANWLCKHGNDVTILVNSQHGNTPVYKLSPSIKLIDLGVNYIKGVSYLHPKNFSKVSKHVFKLKKALQQLKPDVVITLSLQFDYYFLPFITKAKTIREFHSSRYLYDINRKKASILKKIKYKLHDFIEKKYTYNVVLNKDEKKHFKSDNVVVIPNGIQIKNELKAELTNKTVIAAGRLAPVKNFEELFEIWKSISVKFPDWKLKIYGEGTNEYKNKLQSLINSLGIMNSCCLCGATNNLEEKMLNASIFVMTSHTECYPMVLLEAKNVGLPIVSYNSPYGPKNIIDNKNDGFIVDLYDKERFIKRIEELMNNKNIRIEFGTNSKKRIQKNELYNNMGQWLNLLK